MSSYLWEGAEEMILFVDLGEGPEWKLERGRGTAFFAFFILNRLNILVT